MGNKIGICTQIQNVNRSINQPFLYLRENKEGSWRSLFNGRKSTRWTTRWVGTLNGVCVCVCVCVCCEHPRSLEGQDAKMASLLWLPSFHLCAYFLFLLSDLLSGSAARMLIIPPALAGAAFASLSSSLPSWGLYISYQHSDWSCCIPPHVYGGEAWVTVEHA